jgi:hypothetical protein
MKNALLTGAAMLCIGASFAQTSSLLKRPSQQLNPHQRSIMQLLQGQQTNSNSMAKTTSSQKRLIAYSYSEGQTMLDSAHHYYSGTRGSVHPNAYSYREVYAPQGYGNYVGGQNMNVQYIMSDSSLTWFFGELTQELNPWSRMVYTYDTQNRAIGYENQNFFYYHFNTLLNYDASGKLESFALQDTTGTGTLTTTNVSTVFYNGAGLRVDDTMYTVAGNVPIYVREYEYDAAGDMVHSASINWMGAGWEYTSNEYYQFDASGRLVSFATQYYDGSSLLNYWKDSFTYAGTSTNFSVSRNYFWSDVTDSWVPNQMERDITNAQGLVDTYYVHQWNAAKNDYDTLERDYLVYDADGLAQYGHGFLYLNGAFETTPYDAQHFYYETIPTSIAGVRPCNTLTVYPNPAKDCITIGGRVEEGSMATLYSMDGRLLKQAMLSNSTSSIDVSAYPPASYLLILRGKKGNTLHTQICIKQ